MSGDTKVYTYPSNWTVFRGAIGYILSGIACTLAGYALSATGHNWPSPTEWEQFLIFWLFLGGGHANHAALYEQTNVQEDHEQILHAFARDVPLALLGFGGIALLFYHRSHSGDPLGQPNWYLRLAAAVAPMVILSIHRKWRWGVDPKLFTFRSRSYFPALSTCLPAFLFGSLSDSSTYVLIGTSLLILLLWFASPRMPLGYAVGLQAFLLLAATVVVFLYSHSLSIRISIFGVFLTLAMGVSEAWRVTSRIQAGVEYRPRRPYTTEEASFYLGGTNLATAVFLPLFLITYLHPQTKPRYLILVILVVSFGYVLWFLWGRRAGYRALTFVAFGFGISLPIVLIFGAQLRGDATFPYKADLSAMGTLFTVGGFMVAALGPGLIKYIRMYKRRESFTKYHLPIDSCLELTQCLSALLAILGLVAVYVLKTFSGEQLASLDRISWLTTGYLGLVVVIFCCRGVNRGLQKEGPVDE